MSKLSVQERFAPHSICFGCGPANERGLRIRSFESDQTPTGLVAEFHPDSHHQAFPGVVNGGILGALLDCHANWSAAMFLRGERQLEAPPTTVTAAFRVELKAPTPTDTPLHLASSVENCRGDRVDVQATLHAEGKLCATCQGTFVAVKPGHPAYGRW